MSGRKSRRQALGQHFLHDRGILDRIVRAIDPRDEETLVEIGPGKGALTFRLAEKAGRVIAVERDARFIPDLEAGEHSNVTVIESDILKIKLENLTPHQPFKLVGNLPYSISTPILFKALDEAFCLSRCVFLLQKEVGDRVCAVPGTKAYAPLSILIQNLYAAKILFTIPPGAFSPPPKVDSAVVALTKRAEPLYASAGTAAFRTFLKLSFRHRRKTFLNNLLILRVSREVLGDLFLEAGIKEKDRSEQLSIGTFVRFFEGLNERDPGVFGHGPTAGGR